MEYNEFKDSILNELKDRLDEALDIQLREVTKNNGVVLDGIVIARKDAKIAPTFYINDLYDMYEKGKDYEDILDFLIDSYNEHSSDFFFDPNEFEDFGRMKNNIMFKVINAKLNEDLLKGIPHREFLDLAICYYVYIKDQNFERGSILINNEHMKLWGVDENSLYEISRSNTKENLDVDFMSMYDMLCEIMSKRGEDEEFIKEALKPMDDKMYILTNKDRHFGASCIVYNDVFQEIAKEKESDLIIIPSSVHELIIILSEEDGRIDEFNDMVSEVNINHVLPQEILSDHVYIYDRLKDEIRIC